MSEKSSRPTRRKFLGQATLAAAALGPAPGAAAQSPKSIKPDISARSEARVVGANDLSFAKTRFICVFNNFACLSPNQNFRDQNLILE